MENQLSTSEMYIKRCLELAKLGKGKVAPNPLVGAIIVYDGEIIGEGYHQIYGGAHAEVNAIQNVKDKSLLSKSTLYVNLEPCNHYGKTPPCSLLIVEHKIPKVVVGCIDSFSEVSGKGIETLKNNGIEVVAGVLEEESRFLNRRFFTFHNKQRPYIILKWAQSQNGYLDIDRSENQKGVHWITAPKTQQLTHKWRSEETAILVGKNTAIIDNPSLTCSAIEGKNPIRILIDRKLEVDENSNILNTASRTFIFNELKNAEKEHLNYFIINFEENIIPQILNMLYKKNIQSLIVEGGKITLEKFIELEIWDEARILTGKSNIKKGNLAPKINNYISESYKKGNDLIQISYND